MSVRPVVTWLSQGGALFWAGVVFFFWVVIGLIWLVEYSQKWLLDEQALPVKNLYVLGELQQVESSDVRAVIESEIQQSLFSIDVDIIQQRVEALGWVKQVSVRKEWPDSLNVYIVEQPAIAQWNGDFLLNQQGEVFHADSSKLAQPLANLFGPEGDEDQALNWYRQFSELLELYQLKITELNLSERHALQLTLQNGMKLMLGSESKTWINRSKRFWDVYPTLTTKHQIAIVDLRYDTGFAITEVDQTK